MFAPLVLLSSLSNASAGGQLEQPSDVNNSTITGPAFVDSVDVLASTGRSEGRPTKQNEPSIKPKPRAQKISSLDIWLYQLQQLVIRKFTGVNHIDALPGEHNEIDIANA